MSAAWSSEGEQTLLFITVSSQDFLEMVEGRADADSRYKNWN